MSHPTTVPTSTMPWTGNSSFLFVSLFVDIHYGLLFISFFSCLVACTVFGLFIWFPQSLT
jgi:hypothetical protein